MTVGDLTAAQLLDAIRIFLQEAYANGEIPANRMHFKNLSPDQSLDEMLTVPGVEHLPRQLPDRPQGYAFRVGASWYPHLKLTLQPYDGPPGFVFGVDTHDNFRVAADNPEADAIRQLQAKNHELARRIEQAWEDASLPTQSGLLRRFLAQARANKTAASSAGGGL